MNSRRKNIPVITNISIEPFFSRELSQLFLEPDISVEVTPVPYMEYRKYGDVYGKADMIFIWLNMEAIVQDFDNGDTEFWKACISDIKQLYEEICSCLSEVSQADVVIALFEHYSSYLPIVTGYNGDAVINELNRSLTESLSGQAVFLDLMHIIASVGISNAYCTKNKYRWNYPYSRTLTKAIAAEIYKRYLINTGNTKKCVVVDCDNVLWGGILSEDGMENLKLGNSGLGREYLDFQRFLLSLYRRGVLLAVCSKNDLPDVLAVFREHGEMLLQEEHIICFQVNWDNKPDNIARIAETLHIGLDSIVFVDDSPAEIEAMRVMLPEVTAIRYHRETVYGQFGCFHLKSRFVDGEYARRNETYRTDYDRQLLRQESGSYQDYIASLAMEIDIHKAVMPEAARISELTWRTNRCTNGKRYSVADVRRSIERPEVQLYSVHLKDRYSDLGLVGAMEVVGDKLTLFSLSCRALGREVENDMIRFLKQEYGVSEIEFAGTGRNAELKELFDKAFGQLKWSGDL